MKTLVLAAAASLLAVGAPATAQTVVAGADFTTGTGSFTQSATGNGGVASGATYAACCQTSPGYTNNFYAFGGGGQTSATLSSTFATIIGALYTVSFKFGALGNPSSADPLSFTVGAAPSQVFSASPNPALPGSFQTGSFTFTGTGTPTSLSITSASVGDADAIIDDVTVSTAVPEPAAWALMIVGFGAVGAAMRRRTKGNVRFA